MTRPVTLLALAVLLLASSRLCAAQSPPPAPEDPTPPLGTPDVPPADGSANMSTTVRATPAPGSCDGLDVLPCDERADCIFDAGLGCRAVRVPALL